MAWKMDLGMLGILFKGSQFTWANNQEVPNAIFERLDLAYENKKWLDLLPQTYLQHLPILCSDHAHLILNAQTPCKIKGKTYKLKAWCLCYPQIERYVQQAWQECP